jgi:coenzyme F420 hydrogenase subunit beta
VLVRTEAGRQLLRRAIDAGYLNLVPVDASKVLNSQRNLVAKRGAIGGRVAMMKMLGLPVPRLRGFALYKNWRRLTIEAKLRSTLGTIRRIIARGFHRPLHLSETQNEN